MESAIYDNSKLQQKTIKGKQKIYTFVFPRELKEKLVINNKRWLIKISLSTAEYGQQNCIVKQISATIWKQ